MKLKTISLIALLVLLAAGAGVATSLRSHRNSYPAYTLRSQVTEFDEKGNQYTSEMIRYVASSGNYRTLHIRDGRKREDFFERGRGFFSVNFKDKKLVRHTKASTEMPPVYTKEDLLNGPQYNRTETLMGLTVYVRRIVDAPSGQMTEGYDAPELGVFPLKTVNYDPQGKPYLALEPISLTFGEPDPSLVKGPDFPAEDETR
ncbi:MAG: hypothetical protein ABR577_02595 [Pyrinomonadaceae bacterium]